MRLFISFTFFLLGSFLWSQDSIYISKTEFIGNKKTKDFIIERELTLESGKYYMICDTARLIESSEINLTNTNLFNYNEITIVNNGIDYTLMVDVTERWYVWPNPIFKVQERNFAAWWDNGHNLNRANYGMFISHYNCRGRREKLDLRLQLGYSKTIGLDYDIPMFKKMGNWGGHLNYSFITRHEIPYTVDNDRWVFLNLENEIVRKENTAYLEIYYRQGFYAKHRMLVDYKNIQLSDTVAQLNPYYLGNNHNKLSYFTLMYQYRIDKRNDKDFPLKGHYLEAEVIKNGVGLLSDVDALYGQAEWKHFFNIHKKLYGAYGLRGKMSTNNFQSFYVERYLGRHELPRAYDQYVIVGQSYYCFKSNLRYEVFNNSNIQLPLINNPKFGKLHLANYISTFFDFGRVWDNTSYRNTTLSNVNLYSYGLGLETTTYYDAVLRIEYSRNHLRKSRFFIHFTAPI